MKTYVEWDNRQDQHNDGFVSVVINGKLIEYIFVNDQELSPYDLIEFLKEKYNIKKEIVLETNWKDK